MNRAMKAVLAQPWAIMPDQLELIAEIAEREHEYAGNVEALEAKLGRPLGNTMSASVRDGVATIPVEGPLFRRANLMTEFSGATSYDLLARDFTAALEDPAVKAIVLYIDSPGGQTNGASEFAGMVYAARGKKPITAYIGGTGASAALWIAAAADRVVANDSAIIGSVGAQMGMTISEPRQGQKSYRFVSSQSPLKNAEPHTEAGARESQRLVDDLASVFISALATYRGTNTDTILSKYGQGAVFVASDALSRGMIDAVGSYENVLSDLSKPKGFSMDFSSLTAEQLAANRPDLVAAIGEQAVAKVDLSAARAEGAKAERDRLAGIEALAMPGAEAIISAAKADPAATPEATALKVVAAMRDGGLKPAAAANPGAAILAGIQQTEASIEAPVATGPEGSKDKPASPMDFILQSASLAGIDGAGA